ncbi:MAG: sn-glycerol-3-phosphate ABC transporter ATP-binding protein UgpC [Vampirovibrionales bacterium]|nr:sn-glycerol-3-phosphate ABC transporter ATP-binding protein UgpC [Cyanobacteria bacterium HKST-UBA03]
MADATESHPSHHTGCLSKVALTGVSKSFGNTDVLKAINLNVASGEFVVLVGPSGCGKTTVLRLIAGLEEVSAGAIEIEAHTVNNVPPKDRDIAMVFQNYALYPHMSVYDNMAFALKMRKTPKDDIDRRVREAAQILELTHLLDRKPKQLSGGQRQRVALGRAIVRNPKVFLMDEPLSNLDAKLRVQMRSEIQKLHRRLNATTLYVTHDQVEAMTMGDRIVVLNGGVIQQCAAPMAVYTQPANEFVGGFIGTMHFLDGTVEDGHVRLDGDTCWPVPETVKPSLKNGQAIRIGIRPEWFSPAHRGDVVVEFGVEPTLVETLGADTLVHFSLCGHNLTATVPTVWKPVVGQPFTLTLSMDRINYFDPNTTLNLLLDSKPTATV